MNKLLKKLNESKKYINEKIPYTPDFAIVLGSGLSSFVDDIKNPIIIDYKDIPHFPKTTIKGHQGKLICGELSGKKVLLMSGRFHYYEGHSIKKVVYPTRLFHRLGIKNLILTNASGGVNPKFSIGDVMIIKDHINFMPAHPLRGLNVEELGPRFVPMNEAYDSEMIGLAEKIANKYQIPYQKGVYFGLQGPTFETPAEYNMIKILGADAVGMSTVAENIVARHMGMKVFALSIITDLGGDAFEGDQKENLVSHEEVLDAATKAMPHVKSLLKEFVKEYKV